MNVFVIGSRALGAAVLDRIHPVHHVGGVAAPRTAAAGGPDRLRAAAIDAGIPVVDVAALAADVVPDDVDVLVLAHHHGHVGPELRARARHGALGYHPSLLPRWRGRAAVQATIAAGDAIAGGSTYWLDNGYDTGPIIAQRHCHVLPGETARQLWERALFPIGVDLIETSLRQLAADPQVPGHPQDDRFATVATAPG